MASISDILMEQGRRAGELRRQRANVWIPTIQQLSNLPAQVMADRQAESLAREDAFDRRQQRDVRGQQLETGARELAAGDQATKDEQDMTALLSEPGSLDETGTIVWPKVLATAQQKAPRLLQRLNKAKYEHDDVVAKAALTAAQTASANRANQPQDYTLNPGDVRRSGKDNSELASVPVTPPKPTMREVIVKGLNGRPVKKLVSEDELMKGVEQYEKPDAPNQGPQPGWQWVVRDGKEVYTNRVKDGDKPQNARVKATEDERKTAGFYGQMSDAIKVLDELEPTLTEGELYQIQTLPQEDLVGMANRGSLSENAKRYLRAFEQFTESRLRPVSGAAINDAEYARDRRTYARQYSETPKLSEDRKTARKRALDSLRKRAGVALDESDDKERDPLGLGF